MRIVISLLLAIVFISACQSNKKTEIEQQSNIHKVIAQEVLHVGEYTYLRVLENGIEKWIAAPSTQVEIGQTYYFEKGMEMKNFESKELNRTFETIYFVDRMSTDPEIKIQTNAYNSQNKDLSQQNSRPISEKQHVEIKPVVDAITIAELYKNMKAYEGKSIKIKGKVTKFNPAILKKNWIHLQDGTEFNDRFDLTATIDTEVSVGDIVTIEGTVSLNKDFGYGYTYELLIENAVLEK